jgi:Zn-dependent protease
VGRVGNAAALPGPRWPSALRLGRVLGFRLFLSPSWLLLAVPLTAGYARILGPQPGAAAYAAGLGFLLLLVASVLAHELGHAFACRRAGIGVRGITLELLGGYTELDREPPAPRIAAAVALAGPAVSLLLGLVGVAGVLLTPRDALVRQFAFQLALSNLVVAVFNVLPGLPLDGGRALAALVWARTGDEHLGNRVAGWAGRALAVACVAAALLLHLHGVLTFVGAVIVLLVAFSVARGAGQAVRVGRFGARLPMLHAASLARPIYRVPTGTSLAEAHRRAAADGADGLILAVEDTVGTVRALVHPAAAAAVPVERRSAIAVDTVARGVPARRVLPAGLRGADVVRAVQADPGAEYLVASGEDVIGVLRGADVAHVLAAREISR